MAELSYSLEWKDWKWDGRGTYTFPVYNPIAEEWYVEKPGTNDHMVVSHIDYEEHRPKIKSRYGNV